MIMTTPTMMTMMTARAAAATVAATATTAIATAVAVMATANKIDTEHLQSTTCFYMVKQIIIMSML